jgi:hypothetical protein
MRWPPIRPVPVGPFGIAAALVLSACGAQPAPAVKPTALSGIPTIDARAATAAPAPPPDLLTNANWAAVAADPLKFVGRGVTISGQVFNLEEDQSRVGLQMYTDPLHAAGNTVVVYPKQGFPPVVKGDQVEVEGKLVGTFSGKADSGQVLTLPKVEASSVRVLNRASASAVASASASASAAPPASARPSVSAAPPRPPPQPAPPPAPTATPRPVTAGIFRVAGTGASGLTVRAGPNATQARLGVVHDGDLLQVVAQAAPGWAQVTGSGFNGFVATPYLTGPLNVPNPQLAKLAPR